MGKLKEEDLWDRPRQIYINGIVRVTGGETERVETEDNR